MNFSGTTAKASLTSNRSIWSSVMPALASTLRAAGTGRVEHQRRVVAHVGRGHDPGPGRQPVGTGVLGAGDEQRGGAVDHARGVPGVVDVLDLRGPGNAGRSSCGRSARRRSARCRRSPRSSAAARPACRRWCRDGGTPRGRAAGCPRDRGPRRGSCRSAPRRWRWPPGAWEDSASSSRARRGMPSRVAMASAATPWLGWGQMARRCSLPESMKKPPPSTLLVP